MDDSCSTTTVPNQKETSTTTISTSNPCNSSSINNTTSTDPHAPQQVATPPEWNGFYVKEHNNCVSIIHALEPKEVSGKKVNGKFMFIFCSERCDAYFDFGDF